MLTSRPSESLFVPMYQRGFRWTVFLKSGSGDCYENLSRNFKFGSNHTKISDTLHGDQTTYIVLLPAILNRHKSTVFE